MINEILGYYETQLYNNDAQLSEKNKLIIHTPINIPLLINSQKETLFLILHGLLNWCYNSLSKRKIIVELKTVVGRTIEIWFIITRT